MTDHPQAEDYSGHVEPGGAPAVRTLPGLQITKVSVGSMDNNAYLLECRSTGERCLVDAADEAGRLLHLVRDRQLGLVVTTHHHPDHWQALPEVVDATDARTAAGRADADALPVTVDVLLDDGATLEVGQARLEVISLVGHTPGSVALLYNDADGHPHLFTGDSLFPGGPGRTGSPEAFTSLMNDLEAKVFSRLPDETWVYPGHGDDTTLGRERPHLREWRARGW